MRKLIIIFSIMMMCVGLFGCSASGDLKIPSNLELKDEYRNDVSAEFGKNFNKCTEHAIYMYENIENIKEEDLKEANALYKILSNSSNSGKNTNLTESEKILAKRNLAITGDVLVIYGDGIKEKFEIELVEDMQILLDLYK